VRFTGEALKAIESQAKANNKTVSEWIRGTVTQQFSKNFNEAYMTYEKLQKFALKHGPVTAGPNRRSNNSPKRRQGLIDAVEKAVRFEYRGKSYSKEEFEALVSTAN